MDEIGARRVNENCAGNYEIKNLWLVHKMILINMWPSQISVGCFNTRPAQRGGAHKEHQHRMRDNQSDWCLYLLNQKIYRLKKEYIGSTAQKKTNKITKFLINAFL